MDEIVVHKFGGSCLRDGNDIDQIAEIIRSSEGRPIIVVSALWGMTDRLIRASREPRYASRLVQDLISQHLRFAPGLDTGEFGELFNRVISGISKELLKFSSGEESMRSENLILAAGERLSALAVAHRLRKSGIEDAHPVGAEDIGLRLKGIGRAKEIDIQASSVNLDRRELIGVPILTGWFGEGDDGNIALLTRGGSDHSAAAFANLMDASKLILWKDVDGIKQLNPRWGIETPSISYLGYGQAAELSMHGTPVIHPATVYPLIEEGIPIEIKNFHNRNSPVSTIIGPDIETAEIIAIGCQPGVAIITDNKPLSSDLLLEIERLGIIPWLMKSTPDGFKIILPKHDLHHLENIIPGKIEFKTAIISIIGKSHIGIEHELISTNEYGTRIIVETDQLHDTIRELYQSLFSRQDCK
jgi:aspartate kinase